MSADPTTNLLGRMERMTIRRIRPRARPHARTLRAASANDDDVLAGHALRGADAVARTRRRPEPGCPRRPGRGVSPRRDGRRRSRNRAGPGRPAGRRRGRSSVPVSRIEREGGSADRSSGSVGSAIQTASHEPVSSQRTSKSATAPPTPAIGVAGRGRRGAIVGRPLDESQATAGPGSCRWTGAAVRTVPSQATARPPVGSTAGRQGRLERRSRSPVAGSMTNADRSAVTVGPRRRMPAGCR